MNFETMVSLFEATVLVVNAALFPMVDFEIIPAAPREETMALVAEEFVDREFQFQQPIESMNQILNLENVEEAQYQFAQKSAIQELLEAGPTEEEIQQMEEKQRELEQEAMRDLWDLTNDGKDALQSSIEEEQKRIENAVAMSTEEVQHF